MDCVSARGSRWSHTRAPLESSQSMSQRKTIRTGQGDFAKRRRKMRASGCIGWSSLQIQRIWSPTD